MIIIGHELIPYSPLYKVSSKDEIQKTVPNSTIFMNFSHIKLAKYALSQDINIALHVEGIKEACLANALGAKYITVEDNIAKSIQALATEYLFDSKILLLVEDESGIEVAAKSYIDGILLSKAIVVV